jgi:starch synthase
MAEVPKVSVVVGGRWHAFDLALGLKRRGALKHLITNYPWFKVARWGFDRNEVVCLPASQAINQAVHRLAPEGSRWRFQYFIHSLFAKKAAAHIGDAEIVHGWSSFSLASLVKARRAGIPFILERGSSHMSVQCRILREERSKIGLTGEFTHPKVASMELIEYERATAIAVPSRFVEGTFIEAGVAPSRLVRNTLGVNLRHFQPPKEKWGDKAFTIVFAGSLSYRKGLHYLSKAFRLLDVPDARLLLVGGSVSETDALLGSRQDGIRRVGHVPQAELLSHYHASSVFAIASIEEGLAMVQAQALATGLPLVCTTNTGGEDLLEILNAGQAPILESNGVRRYRAGFVVPVGNPESMAYCLRRLHDDPVLLQNQRRAALEIHAAPLDWQAYADRALEIYSGILAPKRAD